MSSKPAEADTPNVSANSKSPHPLLHQSGSETSNFGIGSIYVIPAPQDFIERSDEKTPPPHQLLKFGPNKEPVLIIPEYRVGHVIPGVQRRPIISESQKIKTETKSQAEEKSDEENKVSVTASNSKPQESTELKESYSLDQLTRLLSYEHRNKSNLTDESPITCLEKFTGADGVVLFDIFGSWGVNTILQLIEFPHHHPNEVLTLKETSMFPDIEEFSFKVKKLFEALKASIPPAPRPIQDLEGISPSICSILYDYALIESIEDLAKFPLQFPGIFSMLCETKQIPNLHLLISKAQSPLSSSSQSNNKPSSTSSNNPSTSNQIPAVNSSNHKSNVVIGKLESVDPFFIQSSNSIGQSSFR